MRLFAWCRVFSPWKEERGGAAQGGFLLLGLFIPLKHKLGWLVKPVLSVIDYQLLNCFFFLRKEIRPCREKLDYRNFILRVAQGFRANSLKRSTAPLRVRSRTFSRSKFKSCHDIDPYKDSRTSKYCDRCNSATCSNHAKILGRQCFAS